MAIVPLTNGIDNRAILVDTTGTATGTAGNPLVTTAGGGGAAAVSAVDEAAWTAGTSSFDPTGGVFNDTAAALTSGQQGTVRLTNNRALHVNLRSQNATEILPVPAALADATANPTLSQLQTFPAAWNGATWDRVITANGGNNGGGTGLLGINYLVFDTVNGQYRRTNSAASAVAGGLDGTRVLACGLLAYQGANSWAVLSAPADGLGVASTGNALQVAGTDGTNARRFLTDSSGRSVVVGAAAAGAVPAGNPILLGAVDPAGGTTVNNLQVVSAAQPYLRVSIYAAGAAITALTTSADGQAAGAALDTVGFTHLSNGNTWDRARNNLDVVLQASTATTAGTVNYDITNFNGRYLFIHYNVTSYNGGTLTITVQMKDANGLFVNIPNATTGGLTSGADPILIVGPGSWPANASPVFYANAALPRTIRIVQTVATATITMSGAYSIAMA